MSNAYSNLSEIIFGDLFIRQDNTYNFRTNGEFQIPRVNTFWNGSNSIRYFRPIILNLVLA